MKESDRSNKIHSIRRAIGKEGKEAHKLRFKKKIGNVIKCRRT